MFDMNKGRVPELRSKKLQYQRHRALQGSKSLMTYSNSGRRFCRARPNLSAWEVTNVELISLLFVYIAHLRNHSRS